jgi:class 3 adenylate cyclase
MSSLFYKEETTLEQAQKLLSPDQSNPITQEHFQQLVIAYDKILKNLKRTTKFNDQNERQLLVANEKIQRVANSVSKYLPQQVYQSIFEGKQNTEVRARRKPLTIFFSDIASFTETTEHLSSEDLVKALNYYLSKMFSICEKWGGTIDKTIGDAILIFFGDPASEGVEQDALKCVGMAIEMRSELGKMQKELYDMGITRPFKARMGISSGYCTVGNFGGKQRMDYTIIGEVVNQSSRIESKSAADQILISHQTYALVKKEIYCQEKGALLVKGVGHPLMTYEVVDSFKKIRQDQKEAEEILAGFSIYFDRELMRSDQKQAILERLDQLKKKVEGTLFFDHINLDINN